MHLVPKNRLSKKLSAINYMTRKMAVPTIDRVRKHRAKTNSTPEGREKMKAKGREYKARSRRKMRIKTLTEERMNIRKMLHPAEQKQASIKANQYRDDLIQDVDVARKLNIDEQQQLDIKVLEFEIGIIKNMQKYSVEKKYVAHCGKPRPTPMTTTSMGVTSKTVTPATITSMGINSMDDLLYGDDLMEALSLFLQDPLM
mmetsp:Transcript_1030/g.2282  ORF Transcript_1030/g.2282 Transcript_1030/m.2282 type:complete len:200 (-) Transcript_1030:264-863(-)